MISRTAEYALRATVFLAMNPERAFTVQEISSSTKVKAPYLSKIMQSLARCRIVTSQKGIGGGFMLAIKPGNLTILDIVNAVDPIQRITCCPLELEGHKTKLCALHARLDSATASLEEAYGNSTLQDLLNSPEEAPPLCSADRQELDLA